jgi:hypothetical protein
VLEAEMIRRGARDVKLPGVDGAVVRGTEAQEVRRLMGAALGTRLNVVDVEREGVPAPRKLARLLVA